MKKVAIIICAHCDPEVLQLTLGTWLERYKGDYEAKVYVTLHKNYSHYSDRLLEITSMKNIEFVFVEEIMWQEGAVFRYSEMHSRCLMAALNKVRRSDFTYVAILDHDLVFKEDFIEWCLEHYPESDMTCGLMDDRDADLDLVSSDGVKMVFAPKPTIWHILLSKRLINIIMADISLIIPKEVDGVMYDTFAGVYGLIMDSSIFSVGLASCEELGKAVEHLESMSFNFGFHMARQQKAAECNWEHTDNEKEYHRRSDEANLLYLDRVDKVKADYNVRFPDGIERLLGKLDNS